MQLHRSAPSSWGECLRSSWMAALIVVILCTLAGATCENDAHAAPPKWKTKANLRVPSKGVVQPAPSKALPAKANSLAARHPVAKPTAAETAAVAPSSKPQGASPAALNLPPLDMSPPDAGPPSDAGAPALGARPGAGPAPQDPAAHALAAPTAPEHAAPATPAATSHSEPQPEGRSTVVIKTVLGLLLLLALAFLGGHPRVRGLERAVGVSRVMAAGLPFVLLGFIMRHPAVKVLTDSVLNDLDPVLLLGLGWIGFVMGFRTDARVFEEVTAGVKQLVLGRALAAGILIVGSTTGLLYFLSPVTPRSLTDPTLLRGGLVLGSVGTLMSLSTPHLLAMRNGTPQAVGIMAQVVRIQEVVGLAGMLFLSAYFRPHGNAVSWQIPGTAWLFITLGLGVTIGILVYTILLRLSTNTAESAVLILGSVSFAAGVAAGLRLSPVTVCFVGGMVLANFPGPHKDRVRETLERLERPIYLLFLIVVGASLRVDESAGWILMAAFVLARILGFAIGARLAFDARGLPLGRLGWLVLVVPPMGSLPIAIVISAKLLYPDGAISELVTAVVGGAFSSEIIVQVATRAFMPGSGAPAAAPPASDAPPAGDAALPSAPAQKEEK